MAGSMPDTAQYSNFRYIIYSLETSALPYLFVFRWFIRAICMDLPAEGVLLTGLLGKNLNHPMANQKLCPPHVYI